MESDARRRIPGDGYSGGDAPGLAFENAGIGCTRSKVAAIATDTWGAEVRPNETDEANQPWHWISISDYGAYRRRNFLISGNSRRECAEDKALRVSFSSRRRLPVTGGRGFAGESPCDQNKKRNQLHRRKVAATPDTFPASEDPGLQQLHVRRMYCRPASSEAGVFSGQFQKRGHDN